MARFVLMPFREGTSKLYLLSTVVVGAIADVTGVELGTSALAVVTGVELGTSALAGVTGVELGTSARAVVTGVELGTSVLAGVTLLVDLFGVVTCRVTGFLGEVCSGSKEQCNKLVMCV